MSLGKLKRRLRALINRKDFTDELAGDFIQDAIADMERVLRIGSMESVLMQDTWNGVSNAIIIPPDFLEMCNLFTDEQELTQMDLAKFIAVNTKGTLPTHFVKVADRWLVKPTPAPGSKVYLHYYKQSKPLEVETDENVWSQSAFNAVLYNAAALAADFYQMENEYAERFLAKANSYVEALVAQDLDEKWAGRIQIPLPQDVGEY